MPLCEAIGVAVAISTWRHQFADRQVLFRTDCLPVVHGINKRRSSCSSSEWQNAVYRFITSSMLVVIKTIGRWKSQAYQLYVDIDLNIMCSAAVQVGKLKGMFGGNDVSSSMLR